MNDFSLWAQSALQFPTMAVCVIDTTSIDKDAATTRVYVATTTGVIYDQLLWSERHRTSNEQYTGIPEDTLLEMPTLPEEWEHIKATLTSHYLVAYNLDFVQQHLNENAEHYGLEPFYLIGENLQENAVGYLRSIPGAYVSYGLKLVEACARIGHTMPEHAAAPDRAAGQLALLQALAEDAGDTVVDHPF